MSADPDAPPVRVTIDALAALARQKGEGRFQTRLVEELARRWPHALEATVLVRPTSPLLDWSLPPSWQRVVLGGRTDLARSTIDVPRALRRLGADVFLTTTDRLLAPPSTAVILYVFEHPAYRSRMDDLDSGTPRPQRLSNHLTLRWFPRTLSRADAIVTASTSTARDLVYFGGADPSRVAPVLPGPFVDGAGVAGVAGNEAAPTASPGRRRPAILTFIDRDPRDNGALAVEAFSAAPAPWTLEVVGDAPDPVVATATTSAAGAAGRITFHGRLPDDELVALYRSCSVLLDLSLYEGFGAQVAEALAFGLRCITSDVTSLPEVTAGAPGTVLVNPHDPAAARAAVARVTSEPVPPGAGAPSGPTSDGWARLTDHLVGLCQRLRRT